MKWYIYLFAGFIFSSCSSAQEKDNELFIKPWKDNPYYWQYKGKPLLLLGATDSDNLFQNHNLESHLDSLQAIGGNYIRNTMSDRDPGDQRAFAEITDGKYDLNQWNDEYWQRFENLLNLTNERDIIVQIEVWDRFDHSRENWISDPFNPKNNINYTYDESGLDSIYPLHPSRNKQPFFFSVPGLNDNKVLLKYQMAFVKKLISVSLKFENVLYCIDNETSGMEEWATFWAGFIQDNSQGKDIFITQMWDTHDVKTDIHKRTLDYPERYAYVEISQNSQIPGRVNWENAQYIFNYIKDFPRPVNSVKIYGNDPGNWRERGISSQHAVHTFYRNILGGFASSRFHRPSAGLGLNLTSINCIKTIRNIEEYVKMWELIPGMDLIQVPDGNECYIATKEGEKYLIFFTERSMVKLNLINQKGKFGIKWINALNAEWIYDADIYGGSMITIEPPEGLSTCFAVIIK